jgi:hypothetical protein
MFKKEDLRVLTFDESRVLDAGLHLFVLPGLMRKMPFILRDKG